MIVIFSCPLECLLDISTSYQKLKILPFPNLQNVLSITFPILVSGNAIFSEDHTKNLEIGLYSVFLLKLTISQDIFQLILKVYRAHYFLQIKCYYSGPRLHLSFLANYCNSHLPVSLKVRYLTLLF